MCVPTETHKNEHTYIYIHIHYTCTFFLKEKETRTGDMALQPGVFAGLAEVWFPAPIAGSSQPLKTPAPGDLTLWPLLTLVAQIGAKIYTHLVL